jgi:hypothetical protein
VYSLSLIDEQAGLTTGGDNKAGALKPLYLPAKTLPGQA